MHHAVDALVRPHHRSILHLSGISHQRHQQCGGGPVGLLEPRHTHNAKGGLRFTGSHGGDGAGEIAQLTQIVIGVVCLRCQGSSLDNIARQQGGNEAPPQHFRIGRAGGASCVEQGQGISRSALRHRRVTSQEQAIG